MEGLAKTVIVNKKLFGVFFVSYDNGLEQPWASCLGLCLMEYIFGDIFKCGDL